MMYKIVNLVRMYPVIFIDSLKNIKKRCELKQKAHSLSFKINDVNLAIEMLQDMKAQMPLLICEELNFLSKKTRVEKAAMNFG